MINLNHNIVAAMLRRPAKFADDIEMAQCITGVYGGDYGNGYLAAQDLCVEFVKTYTGSFAFITQLKPEAERGELPKRTLKGVLNVIRAEAIAQRDGRKFTNSKFTPRPAGATPAAPVHDTGVVVGHLGSIPVQIILPNGAEMMIRVECPGAKSKWSGWVFISGGVDPQTFSATSKISLPRLGSQKPGETMKLRIADPVIRDAIDTWVGSVGTPAAGPIHVVTTAPTAPPPPAPKPPVTTAKKSETKPAPATPAPEPTEPVVSIRDRVRQRYGM